MNIWVNISYLKTAYLIIVSTNLYHENEDKRMDAAAFELQEIKIVGNNI